MKTYKIPKGTMVRPFRWTKDSTKSFFWIGWTANSILNDGVPTVIAWYFTEDELLPASEVTKSYYVKLVIPDEKYNAFIVYKVDVKEVK